MSEPDASAETETVAPPAPPQSPPRRSFWRLIPGLFEGLHWLTERVISLLRLMVTLAMFAVVAFVLYNAWTSRHTVAVKPFQVPVAVGEVNHKQAGRIIANLLNQHLLKTQDTLQEQLNLSTLDRPVAAEEQVLIEGESIKLPETGITIDNVIEFISGIFGRKNLHGVVYFEPSRSDPQQVRLYLQMTLKGRIITLSEEDLGKERRDTLPATQKDGLNIQLISEMLRASSKEILSIASEDYNLYYFCSRDTHILAHQDGRYQPYFRYCQDIHNPGATPKSLQTLREQLDQPIPAREYLNRGVVEAVVTFLKDESRKKQATLCQSTANRGDAVCTQLLASGKIEPPPPVASGRLESDVISATAVDGSNGSNASMSYSRAPASTILEQIDPVLDPVALDSLAALQQKCDSARAAPPTSNRLDIVPLLEDFCFTQQPLRQQQQTVIAAPEAVRRANQLEGDATQLLHNGLYEQALVKYQDAIRLDCRKAVTWANMGILLSTASEESGVRDVRQGQCALLRATQLNDSAGWMRHSLCAAQAFEADSDLERFLGYESCQQARQLEPLNEALYDKLFYIDIAGRYRQLGKNQQALQAYTRSMLNERARSCHMHKVLTALLALKQTGVAEAGAQACAIYRNSQATETTEEEGVPECEREVNRLAAELDCG
ncbi:MAG: hypothetical protein R3E95_22945 [Thiolinea sp.]